MSSQNIVSHAFSMTRIVLPPLTTTLPSSLRFFDEYRRLNLPRGPQLSRRPATWVKNGVMSKMRNKSYESRIR
ncbi:hypothetical protein M408DRAFT_292830 [Serendipita vermifera MAFF 305830]|uniref:Uncharacterized protein n=1 Tax=Serendipita vermifera MAFF 305830 TaxID=933852 RepID=A0A0C3AC44_SERVB|nr:hypothetical protein M408DRAFT_292830 [Serendipita vermifera MAFF 305830]